MFIAAIIGIEELYITEQKQAARRDEFVADLQAFADENDEYVSSSETISEWIRRNPYVFLLVYQDSDVAPVSVSVPRTDPPSQDSILAEYLGARVDESIERDQLIEDATSGGFYSITFADGRAIVAISEYTENFYFSTFGSVSVIVAALVFILAIVNYVRVIIVRIKRFESDVTIVSEMDMDYEIISDGVDEIARLSSNVERMRRRMLDHIKSEQEAREANTDLITSISHDIRTPLTVLMGYIEMMKERECEDEILQSYISATESTALRLKQLSDDMFKYSLAFGDTKGMTVGAESVFVKYLYGIKASQVFLANAVQLSRLLSGIVEVLLAP